MLLHEVDAHRCEVYARFVADFANENINRSFGMPQAPVLLEAWPKFVCLVAISTLVTIGLTMNLPMSTHCRLVIELQMATIKHAIDLGFGHRCSAL
jgi:hypothetical protein